MKFLSFILMAGVLFYSQVSQSAIINSNITTYSISLDSFAFANQPGNVVGDSQSRRIGNFDSSLGTLVNATLTYETELSSWTYISTESSFPFDSSFVAATSKHLELYFFGSGTWLALGPTGFVDTVTGCVSTFFDPNTNKYICNPSSGRYQRSVSGSIDLFGAGFTVDGLTNDTLGSYFSYSLRNSLTDGFGDKSMTSNSSHYASLYVTYEYMPIPEPSMYALFGIGLLGLVGFSKRRKAA